NPIIRNAGAIALTASTTLTLAQLLSLETWPSFSAAGLTLTLADTAANLLTLTPAQQKPTLTVFQMTASATVTASAAVTLSALPHFSIASGATLTVADSVANLLAQAAALSAFHTAIPAVTESLTANTTVTSSQAAGLAALAGFSPGTGHALTIADTVQNLATLSTVQAAIAQSTTLIGNDTASV